jgi:hypothetical protein
VSGPGDRAPKTLSLGEPTYSFSAEGHGRASNSVDTDIRFSPGSKSSARSHQASAREPGDLDGALPDNVFGEPAQEGKQPQSGSGVEKSDEVVVPKKSAKTRVTPVESMEGRAEAEGNSAASAASSTQCEHDASPCNRSDTEGSLRSPLTQGGSPVREIRSPGSVRGAARKGRPYRVHFWVRRTETKNISLEVSTRPRHHVLGCQVAPENSGEIPWSHRLVCGGHTVPARDFFRQGLPTKLPHEALVSPLADIDQYFRERRVSRGTAGAIHPRFGNLASTEGR